MLNFLGAGYNLFDAKSIKSGIHRIHVSCAVMCAHSLSVAAPTSSRRPKSHRRRRERILGRRLQLSCRRRCRRCSPSRHLLPVSMSVPKASSRSVPLASLEETAREVLEAPRCRHQRRPASTIESKARVQIAQLATLETASDLPH